MASEERNTGITRSAPQQRHERDAWLRAYEEAGAKLGRPIDEKAFREGWNAALAAAAHFVDDATEAGRCAEISCLHDVSVSIQARVSYPNGHPAMEGRVLCTCVLPTMTCRRVGCPYGEGWRHQHAEDPCGIHPGVAMAPRARGDR